MALKTLTINQIFKGHSASQYFGAEGTINTSIAIDPDLPIISTDVRTSGFAVPVGSEPFGNAATIATDIVRILNNPKNTLTYAVTSGGKLLSYSVTQIGLTTVLGSETSIGTVTGSAAVWAEYYNNYIYIFTPTDISRYGPLDNSPTLSNTIWTTVAPLTAAGGGLGKVALTNTTYPSLRGVSLPNHHAFVHGDGSMYFTDFKNGQGLIHRINTKLSGNEGVIDGTTAPSLYNALDLPWGFYPTSVGPYGTSVLITGIYTIDTKVNQGRSAFVLWDPTNTVSFYQGPVFLPDPLCTAQLNVNGIVHFWTGNAQNGVRVSRYLGGESVREVVYQEEGLPPFPGAVDVLGNRIVWGGFSTNPTVGAVVWAYGSKDGRLPAGLHNVMKTSSVGTTPIVTALKYVQQNSNIAPKVVVAWRNESTRNIEQYSTTATLTSVLRWMFNVGRKFEIKKISVPLGGAVAANTTITPTLYFDDLSSNKVLTVINNTNYASKRKIIYRGTELKDTVALNNMVLELAWTGTNPLPVAFPIFIDIDIKEDESTG